MYEGLTLNKLHKNVSIMDQYKGISVKVMYFGQLYSYIFHLGPHGKTSNMVYH